MKPLRKWMAGAHPVDIEALARVSGTSKEHLYHIATGRRGASAELAGRIADATVKLCEKSKGRLPILTRGELCAACKACPHMKACAEEALV